MFECACPYAHVSVHVCVLPAGCECVWCIFVHVCVHGCMCAGCIVWGVGVCFKEEE